jgi:hypothetical protein
MVRPSVLRAELLRARSLEEAVSLLWTGSFDPNLFDTPLHVVGGGSAPGLPMLNRMQSILPLVAASDELADDLSPRGAAQTGWRIVNLLASVAAETQELEATVEQTLARAWALSSRTASKQIRTAILEAAASDDDVSSAVAREVAAAGANPYSVVVAALAALRPSPGALPRGLKLPAGVALVPRALGRVIAAIGIAIDEYPANAPR